MVLETLINGILEYVAVVVFVAVVLGVPLCVALAIKWYRN